jgi:cytochrome c biogenesis protein CcmG, thiol:disulfide interchange protein DsbE
MHPNMKNIFTQILALCLLAVGPLRADEFLPMLKANGNVYSNITVTTVTATDVFFTYSNGMGNAKLKNLTPELQKHFNYDAAKGAQAEKQQVENKALYHQYVLKAKPPASVQEEPAAAASSNDDFVAPKLYARSVRGLGPPPFVVEEWVTPQPDAADKFILIDFWATWCGPCHRSIPELNAFSKQYSNRLVVVGISDESAAAVRKMTEPHIEYAVAVDTQARMLKALAVTGIPHCILIDPHGIVRYEGMPGYLENAKLEHFLDKYK